MHNIGNSLVVQWLGLRTFAAEGQDSIPGWGTKIPQAGGAAPQKNRCIIDIYMEYYIDYYIAD